jgi:K+/H+ antiporter YhaU regulatory subunit KhtT
MVALLSLLVVLSVSLLIMRVGSMALTMTGLSRESAQFQAQSAFLGVGFTTRESEHVVGHPVRRRIIMVLMLLGNAGIVITVSGLMLVFLNASGPSGWLPRVAGLTAGAAAIWLLFTSKVIDRHLSRLIGAALQRWTDLEVRDYASLLRLVGEYSVIELRVEPGDWLADKTLAELSLRSEGVLVLGIERTDRSYVGAPRGPTSVQPGDLLIIYGKSSLVKELDRRPAGEAGDQAHLDAVGRQQRAMHAEAMHLSRSRIQG